jgi:hypothetical protein
MEEEPSFLSFLILISSFLIIYILFIRPFQVGAYNAFKNGEWKQYSDGLLINLKKKITLF